MSFVCGFCLVFWCRSRCGSCGRLIGRIPTNSGPNPWGSVRAMSKKPKTYQKINFTHFVFLHFSRVTVKIEHFGLEHRIPGAQLYIFPAGKVWNDEFGSKHFKIAFLMCFVLFVHGVRFLVKYWFSCFSGFCLLFWSRSQFGSCGRRIGRIPTKWRPNLWGSVRAMSTKPKKY